MAEVNAGTTLQVTNNSSFQYGPFRKAGHFPARSGYQETANDNGIRHLLQQQMIRAKRAGTWFGLRRQERGMFELALRLKVKLQRPELLKALVSVLRSLREKFDEGYRALMKAMDIAWAFSDMAIKSGNEQAKEWRRDWNYIKFLARALGRT
jgi:hypothetical protein